MDAVILALPSLLIAARSSTDRFTMNGAVVLLTSAHPHWPALGESARALANAIISSGITLTGIVVESTLQKRSCKHAVRSILGDDLCLRLPSWRWSKEERRLERVERQLQRNADRRLREFLGEQSRAFPNVNLLVTESVNSDESKEFLNREAPDLVVTFATGILKRPVFEAGRLGAVNAHTSVLPDYRGFWPEFWQVYDEAYTKAGISIHFIDEGVDTGDVVHTRHVAVRTGVDPFVLRALNIMQVVRDYPVVIRNILSGTFSRHRQDTPSTPAYRSKDVTLEKKRSLFQRLQVL
jgi:folate-dependent phosphoribosylglycinamide formyltransferase PurN